MTTTTDYDRCPSFVSAAPEDAHDVTGLNVALTNCPCECHNPPQPSSYLICRHCSAAYAEYERIVAPIKE